MDYLTWLLQGGHLQPPPADAFGTGLGTAYDGTPLPAPDMSYGPQQFPGVEAFGSPSMPPDMGYGPQQTGNGGMAGGMKPGPDMSYGPQLTPTGTPQPGGDRILAALRAVQQPKPPDVVKPSTPAAPALRPIQGGIGDLMALMGGPGGGGGQSPYKLPSTLLAALGGGNR